MTHHRAVRWRTHDPWRYASTDGSLLFDTLILSIGWLFGAVAFEVTCLMMKDGFDVKGAVLVDSPCPTDHVTLSVILVDQIVARGGLLCRRQR